MDWFIKDSNCVFTTLQGKRFLKLFRVLIFHILQIKLNIIVCQLKEIPEKVGVSNEGVYWLINAEK